MWSVKNASISMTEGDYGVELPFTISGVTLTAQDRLRFTFKDKRNGETVLSVELTPTNNAVSLEFSEADSAKFSVGEYVYSLDWYQDGSFLCNVIPSASFLVVDKA